MERPHGAPAPSPGPVDQLALSPSQSRVLRKNRDLRLEIRPARIGTAQRDLFHRHKQRFIDGVPEAWTISSARPRNRILCPSWNSRCLSTTA